MTPRARRRWGIAAVWFAAVLGLGGIALAWGERAGWPLLRGPLQSALTRAAGVDVALGGEFRASLLGQPRLQVGELVVGSGGDVAGAHLLRGREVALAWSWTDLWRWWRGDTLRLQSLRLGSIDALLTRLPDGRASWQLGSAGKRAAAAADRGEPWKSLPRFGSLQVASGRIVVDDRVLDTALLIELRGGDERAGAAGPDDGYAASVAGRYRALPLDLQVRTEGALPLLRDLSGSAESPGLRLEVTGTAGAATVSFDGRAAALLGDRRLDGELRLRGPSLASAGQPLGLTLPATGPFDLQGHLSHVKGLWDLRVTRAAIGRSLVSGEFRFDQRLDPPRLSGRLGGSRLALADLGPAVGLPVRAAAAAPARPPGGAAATPRTAPAAPQGRAAGRVLPSRAFDLPSLRSMDADVQVAIDELDLGSAGIAPLHALRAHVLLDQGVLRMQGVEASVAGGRISGSTRLEARQLPARWAADLSFAKIDVAGWIRAFEAPGAAGASRSSARELRQQRDAARRGGAQPVRAYLTGELSGTIRVAGTGRSTAEILGSLDGQARFALGEGTLSHLVTELAGLDLAQALGVWVRGDRPLPLRCARVQLVSQRGVVQLRQALVDSRDSTLFIAGQINLKDESLALRVIVKPKDFSVLSLRTPLSVEGTLGAPKVGIQGTGLAAKLLGAAALGAIATPAAALLLLIDPGSRASADPCATPPG